MTASRGSLDCPFPSSGEGQKLRPEVVELRKLEGINRCAHGGGNVRAWSNRSCGRYSVVMDMCARGRATGDDTTGSGE